VLDRSLNPDIGIGRIADLVRQRVVGTLRQLGSLTEGDVVATDGPITASETPDGGARVVFADLTMRANTAAGDPVVVAFGDVVVDGTDTGGGRVAYRSVVPGPFMIYHEGAPVAELAMGTLTLEGEIDPAVPMLGDADMEIEDARLRIEDQARDPLMLTLARGELDSRGGLAADGTLEGTYSMEGQDFGIARGDRDPTLSIDTLEVSGRSDGVPGAWVEMLELYYGGDRLPSLEQVSATVGRFMGLHELGNNDARFETTGIEIFVTPSESITIDRVGVDMEMNEPVGGIPNGRTMLTLDGLRTRGPDLPMAVDLGALRMTAEGEGMDVARLRGFMAETMQTISTVDLSMDPDTPPDPAQLEQIEALEARMVDGMMGLVRDLGIGEAEMSLALSGLSMRQARTPLLGLERLQIEGGWVETADGRLDGPGSVDLRGLSVTDPTMGMPWRVERVEMESVTREFDLRAVRELMVLFFEAMQATGGPPCRCRR
jgi:hypothetical protein